MMHKNTHKATPTKMHSSHPAGAKHVHANGGNVVALPPAMRNIAGKNTHSSRGPDRAAGNPETGRSKRCVNG